jgi:hypothetical protein
MNSSFKSSLALFQLHPASKELNPSLQLQSSTRFEFNQSHIAANRSSNSSIRETTPWLKNPFIVKASLEQNKHNRSTNITSYEATTHLIANAGQHHIPHSPQTAYLAGLNSKRNLGNTKTISTFNLTANLNTSNNFYDIPYPSDLRLNSQGYPDLSGFPIAKNSKAEDLKKIAGDFPGFPTTSAGYFRFNLPVTPRNPDRLIRPNANSPVLLIDVDSNSSTRGQLLPTVAATPYPDAYVPSFLLAVAPFPGTILQPNHRYAYVIKRSFNDANGKPLGVPATLRQLLNDKKPDAPLGTKSRRLYQPLLETLDRLGIDRQSIAAATVFTTGDTVADTARLSQQVLKRYDLHIEELTLDQVNHPNFYELHGKIRLPQFQQGQPPFNTEGLFQFDQNHQLVQQRTETVPVTITLPKKRMPETGYPVVTYFHGSNGLSTQVVDRGPITQVGGQPTPGLGPAYVLAKQGFATISSASPLNPERFPGGLPSAYLNLFNLAAYRDTIRQGVFEQQLLLDALQHVRIPASLLGGAAKPLLPDNKTNFKLQSSSVMALGQSLGAQYATILAAINPKIRAVVPTGSGGYFSLVAATNSLAPGIGLLLGTLQASNVLHPALQLLQTAWDAADPITYMPFIAQRPLPNQPVRPIYQPIGIGDTQFSEAVFNAVALASHVQQAGVVLAPKLQKSLALAGLNGIVPYPVSDNVRSDSGTPYTGVVVQYKGDGITDPHNIFAQLNAVKKQYSRFFKSFVNTGTATVPAP